MVLSLNYRRPPRVNSITSSLTAEEKEQRNSEDSGTSGTSRSSAPNGIPEALSFDKIISGGTCPPVTTRDFMNYLVYIEHSAENLQFYLWYRDYADRFSKLPENERALAPEWTQAQSDSALQAAQTKTTAAKQKLTPEAAAIFKGTSFAPPGIGMGSDINVSNPGNPFDTPPATGDEASTLNGNSGNAPSVNGSARPQWQSTMSDSSTLAGSNKKDHHKVAAGAFEAAELKWQPFTIQPFREEITRIISTYIADGAPRELNLSSRDRLVTLKALEHTTHPSAFRIIAANAEYSLRQQAHPNFIRWTICNGNRARVIFARGLGVGTILLAFVAAIVLTLSHAPRGWRALAAIGWVIGISTLIAAWKGMCVVLHGMHHRHLRPWELFAESDDESAMDEMKKASFESMESKNSYEDEPWVAKYEKRNIIRKVFDREVWIKEPALRQIQDTIFLQSVGASIIISAVCAGIFVALPHGNFF